MEYSSAFQLCPLRVKVSTIDQRQGSGSLVIEAGPDVSDGVTRPDLAASLVLELKHN